MIEWEPVIGLEIHVELNTQSKLFDSGVNHFGDEPNSNIGEVCVALPGALPVLNQEAVRKAVQFGCAVNAQIATTSHFDRKSYFYPDSPRNFQITQYSHPIVIGGVVTAVVDGEEREFQIHHAHLEDDAGMLKHFTQFAGVDYNRAGVPLLEIVFEPCMHSAKEASAAALAVKAIFQCLDASDCNMEEGSLRVDVNVSVRHRGEQALRNKIEIKNLNSFARLEQAIAHEIERQTKLYTAGETISQATYRWDPEKNRTILMRRKEEAQDYRYFPEPDLLPLVLEPAYIEEIRALLPELPLQKEKRYVQQLNLPANHAFFLASDKKLAAYFEAAVALCPNTKALANWIVVEFLGRCKDRPLYESGIPAQHIASLVTLIDSKAITGKIAKSIADLMVADPTKSPEALVATNPDFRPIHDQTAVEPLVDEVLQANPQSVSDFLAGRDRAFAFLVGQVMKRTKGSASPALVNDLLNQKIAAKAKGAS